MKETPKKRSKSKITLGHDVIELPSNNQDMEKYIISNHVDINDKIVNIIDYALKNKLDGIEIFCFKGSNFVVVLHRKDFKETLQIIYDFSAKREKFETCVRVKKLISLVDKLGFVFKIKKQKK